MILLNLLANGVYLGFIGVRSDRDMGVVASKNKNRFQEKEVSDLEKAISYSDGNLGEAMYILKLDIFRDDNFEDFQVWMRFCYSANIQEMVKWVNERSKKGRRGHSIFLKYSLILFLFH